MDFSIPPNVHDVDECENQKGIIDEATIILETYFSIIAKLKKTY